MIGRDLRRAGAGAAVLAGALLAIGHVLAFTAWRAEEIAGPEVGVTLILAHLAFVLAFVGAGVTLRSRRIRATAIAGAAGAVVVAAVYLVGLGPLVGLNADSLAASPPIVLIGGLGIVAFVAALVSLGVTIAREGGEAGPSGSALVLGTVLLFGGLLELGTVVQTVGSVLIGTAMVWFGVEMWASTWTVEPARLSLRARAARAEITGELDTGRLAAPSSGA